MFNQQGERSLWSHNCGRSSRDLQSYRGQERFYLYPRVTWVWISISERTFWKSKFEANARKKNYEEWICPEMEEATSAIMTHNRLLPLKSLEQRMKGRSTEEPRHHVWVGPDDLQVPRSPEIVGLGPTTQALCAALASPAGWKQPSF